MRCAQSQIHLQPLTTDVLALGVEMRAERSGKLPAFFRFAAGCPCASPAQYCAVADPENTFVEVPLSADLVVALDAFTADHPGVSRPEALATAFRDWAIGRGYLRPDIAQEGIRPEELNATNDD